MKSKRPALALSIPLLALPCSAALFPNGDFESGGASWRETTGDPNTFSFSYPEDGGNPGRYGVIDNLGGNNFGLWVGGDDSILSLASLDLTAGETYNFTQDMILERGSNVGGLKIEFYNGSQAVTPRGSTGDMNPEAINSGTAWATYNFLVNIPVGTDGIKVVPLWGRDSRVGFDNIQVDTDPVSTGTGPIRNADFSLGSFSWRQEGSAETTWKYEETGGNPGAYGVITNTGAGFGLWFANDGDPISLADLGIRNGDTALFQQDMIRLSGTNVGGLKIRYFNGPNFVNETRDFDAEPIGEDSEWATYTFPVVIPESIDGIPVDGIQILTLEGQGSSVGYDNLRVSVLPQPLTANPEGEFVEGTIVSWNPTKPEKFHQPQSSFDGVVWANFGPAYPGTETTTLLDPNSAPFYRVAETEAAGESVLINGDFEIENFADPSCAESWLCFSPSGQEPTRITTDSYSGEASIRIAVQNDDTPNPNNSEVQQNLVASGGFLTAGETYTFSFWAKQISSGVSYVQRFQIQWFDQNQAPIGAPAIPFRDFSGGNGNWTETVVTGLVAPANAAGVFIQIFGGTGAVPSTDARGEVLIDNVTLTPAASDVGTFLETTQAPGIGIFLETRIGQLYQGQVSNDLFLFDNLSGTFTGNGEPVGAGVPLDGQGSRYFRFLEIPDAEGN